VQREVDRNGGRSAYRAGAAQARAVKLRPCRIAVLIADAVLCGKVPAHLESGFSPAGTAHLLGGIATETIYAGVYSGVLGVRACDVLRSRRYRRRRRNAADHRAASHFGGRVHLHPRPAGSDR
jgi:IS30 family transposase